MILRTESPSILVVGNRANSKTEMISLGRLPLDVPRKSERISNFHSGIPFPS